MTEARTVGEAVAVARASNSRVEVSDARDEYSQTFALPNGHLVQEMSLRPQRVRQADSSWVAANASLRRNADGTLSPVASTARMAFSGGGSAAPMAMIADGSSWLKWWWPEVLPAPVVEGSVATYRNVLPGVDLQITAEVDSFTHLLVIRSAKAATNPTVSRLVLRTEAAGVSVVVDGGTGALSARDSSGAEVFGGPSPTMWDSSDAAGGSDVKGDGGRTGPTEPRRAAVRVEVAPGTLTLIPDADMLADSATVWPVYVDPTWSKVSGAKNHWTVLRASEPSRSFYDATSLGSEDAAKGVVRTGRNDFEGPVYRDRSLFDMNVSAVRFKHIFRAVFSLTQSWAGPGCGGTGGVVDLRTINGSFSRVDVWNTSWNTSGAGWGPILASSSAIYRYGNSCGPRRVEFNVTSGVVSLAAAGKSNAYWGLRGRTESGNNEWKRYRLDPGLSIEYNTVPNTPGSLTADAKGCGSQAAPAWITSSTPTLSARATDPDSGQSLLTTSFYWWPQGGALSETNKVMQATGNGGNPSQMVPAGRLVDDTVYVWQAVTKDDVGDGQWSGLCYLKVDSSAPNPPKLVTSSTYPGSGAHGGVGVSGAFQFTPPDAKKEEVTAYAFTLDSGASAAEAPKVAANPSDRTASVTLTPLWDGPHTLRVWTVDAANRASLTALSYSFTVLTGTGPAARWDFDSPACGTGDDARHNNTLTITGAACTAGRAGVGSALLMDGNDHASTAGPATWPHPSTGLPVAVRTDADFTVAAWVRLTATGGTSVQAAVSADGVHASAYRLGYNEVENKWDFAMMATDGTNPVTVRVLSNATVVAGRWTHLAGVYDAATHTLRLYINGQVQTATATLSGGFNATGPVQVGRRKANDVFGDRWKGAIDAVQIYPYVVTANDINLLSVPLPPSVSFPDGSTVTAGEQISIRFDAGGDSNVTSYRYGVASNGDTPLTATPDAAGQAKAVTYTTSQAGQVTVYARTVDGTGDQSLVATATFTVTEPIGSLTGTVIDAFTRDPVVGATVRLDPGGLSVTTGIGGVFQFAAVANGAYTVAASLGDRCALSAATQVEVNGATTTHLALAPMGDLFGYTCRVEPAAFTPADTTVLVLSGDDAVTPVSLPFPVPFYDSTYSSVWVDTNGVLSFADPAGSHPNDGANIPTPSQPNAMVAAYWDDLVVDAAASVRTTTTGSAPNRRFVVEWRNVHRKGNTAQRVTFEAVLAEDGTITVNYASLDGAVEQGEQATVGIESPGGEIGIEYSYHQPVLASGTAVVFAYPGAPLSIGRFDLSGQVTDLSGVAVAGATVVLGQAETTTTTGPDGRYTFPDLESGRYSVSVATGLRCGTYAMAEVDLVADSSSVDLPLSRLSDEFGYTCADGPRTFIPANGQVLALSGDEGFEQVAFPFPVSLYGQSYTSGWVNTNGLLAMTLPEGTPWQPKEIPSPPAGGEPNAAVYPFWHDWMLDAAASIRTATTGTAPNRQFIVEWRNVHHVDDTNLRVTFEVVFSENGAIAFAYADIGSSTIEQGALATIGIENADGTVAFQYSHAELAVSSGHGLLFQPGPPHIGLVGGTVTCNGTPVTGAQVAVAGQSATTGTGGGYQISDIPGGSYSVVATAASGACAGSTAAPLTVFKDITTTVDIALTPAAGYSLTVTPQPFTPANGTVLALTGDEECEQISPLPFPVTLYGQTHTTAWVSTNGLVTFQPTCPSLWDVASIPAPATANQPDNAVYPFWNDWIVDESASVRTAVSGTAPNRTFTVEWRNVVDFTDPAVRATFEVMFRENGDITFAYQNPGPTFTERGGYGTVGVENADGSIAVQYLHRHPALRRDESLLLHPVTP